MDINPLSLLEVTMGNAPPVEDDDDECMIIEDSPNPIMTINDEPINVDEYSEQIVTEMEPEILADTGVHFLQQEDPLSLPSTSGQQHMSISTSNGGDGFWISESERNLTNVSAAEGEYRKCYYNDLYEVLNERLHCTICQDHVGCDITLHPSIIEHPLLKVLICPKCNLIYKSLKFVLGKNGKDVRCRWCGKLSGRPGMTSLRHCQQCYLGFCESCLYNNRLTPRQANWICMGCDSSNLWPARCTLWALKALMRLRVNSSNGNEDLSHCAEQCRKSKGKARTQNRSKGVKKQPKQQKQQFILPKPPEVVQVNGTGYKPSHMVLNGLNGNAEKLLVLSGSSKIGKQTRVVTPPPSTSSAPVPIMAVCPDNNAKMDSAWFRSKLDNYEKDMMNLVLKLKTIREDLLPEDTILNTSKKVETVSTLLTLNSSLIKDCSINLLHEWKEKRSRFQLDNINIGNKAHPNKPVILANLLKSNKVSKSYTVRRKNPSTIILQSQNNAKIPCIDLEVDDLSVKHNIKPCTVKLKKLSPDVINTIKRRGSWNTKIDAF